jgi:hypothetical protein
MSGILPPYNNANHAAARTIAITGAPIVDNTPPSSLAEPRLDDRDSRFNGAVYFAYDSELVDEGMLLLFGGLNIGPSNALSDTSSQNSEPSPDQPSDAFLWDPSETPRRRTRPSNAAAQEEIRFEARVEPSRRLCREDVQTRHRLVSRCSNSRTIAEKIAILGRVISEGKIPESYHQHFRDQIAILRRRFQLEQNAEELVSRNHSQGSKSTSEGHTTENSIAPNGVEFAR